MIFSKLFRRLSALSLVAAALSLAPQLHAGEPRSGVGLRSVRAVDPYSVPDSALLARLPGNLLTGAQARYDLEALFNALRQIHPDIFSVVGQEKLVRRYQDIRASLPDTLSTVEFYRAAAPLVSMIGDGHTMLCIPYDDLLTPGLLSLPLRATVGSDSLMRIDSSTSPDIPVGSVLTAVNGISSSQILSEMMPLVSGERDNLKIMRINSDFAPLFEILYGGKPEYEICFMAPGQNHIEIVTLPAAPDSDIPPRRNPAPQAPYSFTVDPDFHTAVMDVRSFSGKPEQMKQFCDSMFSFLRAEGISDLIIDVSNNAGGNSMVGDVLLSYISPVPFVQIQKMLVNRSPMVLGLTAPTDSLPEIRFFEVAESDYNRPLTPEEGHFDGNVVLITGPDTFSSAASFSEAFKQFGMGNVVGRETGGMNVSFGDVLTWHTPVSRIPCNISWKRFWYPGSDEADIHGTIPDIKAPGDEDAIDYAWPALMGLKKAGFGNTEQFVVLEILDPSNGRLGKITDAIYHAPQGDRKVRILDSQQTDQGIYYKLYFDPNTRFKKDIEFTLIVGDRKMSFKRWPFFEPRAYGI